MSGSLQQMVASGGSSASSDRHRLQQVALILTRAHHACTIGRVDFSAEPSVCFMRYGSITLKSAVGSRVNKGKKKGRDRSGFAPSSLLGRLKNPSHRGGGCYVLVDAEEVGRIILVLYLDQTLEVVAVGCFDAFLALVHHEVYIRPAA